MATHKRKVGEKATLLNNCGELLFGCSGEVLVTQGIYVPKSLSSSPFSFICKRTVWIPLSPLCEHFVHNLESFGATLPFSVQRIASLNCFGLCGIDPTRAIHARDKCFLLLAKFPGKHFAVYGIVETRNADFQNTTFIENISTNKDDILHCVEWIKSETTLYHLSKGTQNRTSHSMTTKETGTREGSLIESEPSTVMQNMQQYPIQKSVETEGEQVVYTPGYPHHTPCEHVNPLTPTFGGAYLPNPNNVFWIPYLPVQSTAEATGGPSSFFLPSQLSSL